MSNKPSTTGISMTIANYCSLFNSHPNPIAVIGQDGEVVYANKSYQNYFGQSLQPLYDYPAVKQVITEYTERLSASKVEEVEVFEEVQVECRTLQFDDKLYGVLTLPVHAKLAFSVGKKTESSESKISHSDKTLIESILSKAHSAVVILNYDSKSYVGANKAAEVLFGYSYSEIEGMHLGDLSPTVIRDGKISKDLADTSISDSIQTGKRVVCQWQIRRKDGTIIPCEVNLVRIPTQNGNYVRLSFVEVSSKEQVDRSSEAIHEDYEGMVSKTLQNQREGQLRAFVRDSPIPVAMLDKNLNYLIVAKEWVQNFPTEYGEDLIGRNHLELNPKLPLRWKLAYKQGLNGNASHMIRDQYVTPDGKDAWCRWDVKPWYKNEQEVGGLIVYMQDISEEVVSETRMLDREKRYKHFFNSDSIGWIEVKAPELVSWVEENKEASFHDLINESSDLLGMVTRYNQKVADIFGLPQNQTLEDFHPIQYVVEGLEDMVSGFFSAIRNHLESFDGEVVIANKYGERRNLVINIHFSIDNFDGTILYGIQDITDVKGSVKALRESEERYRTMFDGNSLGVVYTNYHEPMVKINSAFTKILGYTEDEMQTLHENDMLLPEYVELNKQIDEDFRTGKKRFVSVEKEYRTKSGDTIIAQTASSALYNDAGTHYGNVTIIEDITERKTSELKIRKQNEELKKINKELDQFVYSAAHDLRAPIANVMGLVKLIRMEELSDTAIQYLDLQEKSLSKLDEFIKSIVDYSRNSRLELAKDNIDLDVFLNEIVDQYRFSENAEKLDIKINVDQNCDLITDYNRLSVVLNNLVSNAVRYMDVDKEDCFLHIDATCDNDSACIKVRDNGIGIETEHMHAIFDLFYRANAASKGTGIGLYIVKETVDKLLGTIDVESTYGEGTTFTLCFKNFFNEM